MAPSEIQLSGSETFDASPARLYALLSDLDAAVRFIPDLTEPERVDEHTLRCKVRPGLSFLRGTLKLTVTLSDLVPDESATMHVRAKGIGVEMDVVTRMTIAPRDDGGCGLDWVAAIEKRKGLVATISATLVRAAADHVVSRAWNKIRQELDESTDEPQQRDNDE